MPKYDYRCSATGAVVEVKHCMSDTMRTWGELCAKANIDPGDVPEEAPVERLLSASYVATDSHHGHSSGDAGCSTGGCCGGGGCGCC